MLKTAMKWLLAATLALGLGAAAPQSAEARRGSNIGFGIAAGVLAGAAIGGLAYGRPYYGRPYYYSSGPGCYLGPRQCETVGRRCFENRFGETVCRGGEYRCWRPRYCD